MLGAHKTTIMTSKRRKVHSDSSVSNIDTEATSGRYNSKDSLVAAVSALPVSRVVFIRTILSAVQAESTYVFGYKNSHVLQRVRVLGLVVHSSKQGFLLDDGTGVLRVKTEERSDNFVFEHGKLVEVVGDLRAPDKHIVCLHANAHDDPMYEVMRWNDTVRIYREYYSNPNPKLLEEQQKEGGGISRVSKPHHTHTAPSIEQTNNGQAGWHPYNAHAAAEAAAALSETMASHSQPSQSSQDVAITPLADRIEQVIRMAASGISRDKLVTACGGTDNETVDVALSELLLAGHIYIDNNTYFIV
eukprot:m.159980 g.159980  ORF g.159980 m.159980 type:complete len:302 (+) comp18011_c0_seq2:411-1316(+)